MKRQIHPHCAWLPAAILSFIPFQAAGAQEEPAAIVDRFVDDGLAAFQNVEFQCLDGDPVLEELLSRRLPDQRRMDLAGWFELRSWSRCPSHQVDRWLATQLIESFVRPDRVGPSCSIDCMSIGTPLEGRIWGALWNRGSPNSFALWIEIASSAPSSEVQSSALSIAARSLTEEDRILFFFEQAADPNPPQLFLGYESQALTPIFIRSLDGQGLIDLPDLPVTHSLIDWIGRMALGKPGQSLALPDSALSLLEEAHGVGGSEARRIQLASLIERVKVERQILVMTGAERVSFLISGLEDPGRFPSDFVSHEPHRLARDHPRDLLNGLSPELLVELPEVPGVRELVTEIGRLAEGRIGVALEDANGAMRVLEGALSLSTSGARQVHIQFVLEKALRVRDLQ